MFLTSAQPFSRHLHGQRWLFRDKFIPDSKGIHEGVAVKMKYLVWDMIPCPEIETGGHRNLLSAHAQSIPAHAARYCRQRNRRTDGDCTALVQRRRSLCWAAFAMLNKSKLVIDARQRTSIGWKTALIQHSWRMSVTYSNHGRLTCCQLDICSSSSVTVRAGCRSRISLLGPSATPLLQLWGSR